MEIRFCHHCSESIPDADFDAGKAVAVRGSHYHAACALERSLSIAGPRSWLTFLLALLGAAAAVYLLVTNLSREDVPAVTAPVRAAIEEDVDDATTRLVARIDAGLERTETAMAALAQQTADAVKGDLRTQGEQLVERIAEGERITADHLATARRRVDAIEKEMAALGALLRDVREQADRLEAQRVAAVPPPAPEPQPEPEPEPAMEEPATPPMQDDAQREEVERWIRRLKDPNENIRFTATLQLGLLKSLLATQPLIEALEDDRDYYVRLGAATALGDIRAVDAIPALIEALEDDDALVRTAANDALKAITEQPYEFVPGMSRSERRKLQRRWKDWFEKGETALRDRLGQPKAP